MASIDKTSVRNEVSRLKTDFERLCSEGKVSGEVRVLMNSMLMIVELMLSIFLERKTEKDSKNSSKPPSQTEKDETALSQEGSQSKGKREHNATASNTTVKETVTLSKVRTCDVCGEDLRGTPCDHHQRRTKIDIVFEKLVEHIDAEVKQCSICESTVKGRFPSDMPGPLQYGNGLKAFAVNLLICHRVAINRVQKLVKSMVGTVISEASLLKFVLRLHQVLEHWEFQATEQLLKAPSMNVDETYFRVDNKKHWCNYSPLQVKFSGK